MARHSPPTAHRNSIRRSSPTVGAYLAEPFSVSEIDAHPDRDRIWATIMEARDETQSLTLTGIDITGPK